MLVYVRPSSEALLRARVLGAQDHMGALPILGLSCGLCEHRDHTSFPATFLPSLLLLDPGMGAD